MISRNLVACLLATALSLGFTAPSWAVKATGGEFNTLYAGIGIKGYDPVGYFTDNKAITGDAEITTEYGGVTWRFASKEHRDLFVANPEKYAPQYGGFCAWGVGGANKLFDVDPKDGWTIYEGKLYMNFNSDVNTTFRKDPVTVITQAQRNWPGLNH